MDILLFAVNIFWFITCSYAANGFPPLLRGKHPLDFGKKIRKYRVFGDGKTIEGTIGGIIFGLFIGSLQVLYQDMVPLRLYHMTFPLVIALVIGTMVGDILGSFVKRRFGFKSGDSVMLLDQLGFLLVAFIFASIVQSIDLYIMIALVILTPPIHFLSNCFGYYIMKVKKNPW